MKCQNFVWFPCSWYGKKSCLCFSISSLSFRCLSHSYVLNISWNVTYANSMDHNSSWEANSDSASWEISHILCTFEVHDWVGSPPLVCTLSQINQVNILLSNFLNMDFSIILPPVPVCSPYQNSVCISVLPHTCHVSYPSQHPLDTNCWTVLIMQLCTLHFPASSTHFLLLSY